jgi:hypothetical protein
MNIIKINRSICKYFHTTLADFIFEYTLDEADKVICEGDPELYNSDDDEETINKERRIYKYRELPGNTVIFKFTTKLMNTSISYNMNGASLEEITAFVGALKINGKKSIYLRPGANQDASISTCDGFTTFNGFGAGGSNPVEYNTKIKNADCLSAFESLL